MAEGLYKAMKGAGTRERVLTEILAGCSKDDIQELKKSYEEGAANRLFIYFFYTTYYILVAAIFRESLEDAVRGNTANFARLG